MKQYNIAVSAFQAKAKILSYIPGNNWPSNMEITRTNLLHSSSLDSKIVSNNVNDHNILPTLLKFLRIKHSHLAQECD